VLDAYRLYRPSPLYRARRLERDLDTPAHIYYKYEGVSPSGSHKPNTALAQAFYAKQEGVSRLATETGAGQWGSALAFAGAAFGLEVKVYMVRASYDQKPYRRVLMETYGASVVPSPSLDTQYGRGLLAETPDHTGSLGIAISEAIEDTISHPGTKYSLGSVFDFVLLHQTVIGQETMEQMAMAGEEPDVIIGCAGGGSNFAGLAFPWLGRRFRQGGSYRVIAAEPEAAPSLTRGVYAYDYGDTAKMAPIVKMHTLGSGFVPEPIHAGGLRYHGMSPLVSHLKEGGHIEARSVHQRACFEVGVRFARSEGILPAPEPTHAITVAIDEALEAKASGRPKVILFNLCGHGHFDLSAYERYLSGQLEDYEYPVEKVEAALAGLPKV
jgi:tryptophan synthase beta chain